MLHFKTWFAVFLTATLYACMEPQVVRVIVKNLPSEDASLEDILQEIDEVDTQSNDGNTAYDTAYSTIESDSGIIDNIDETASSDSSSGDTATEDTSTEDTAIEDTASGDTALPIPIDSGLDTDIPPLDDTDIIGGIGETASSDSSSGDTAMEDTSTEDTAIEDTASGDTALPIPIDSGFDTDLPLLDDTGIIGGIGGGVPVLTIPFPDGEMWTATQLYNIGTHIDYGGDTSDDRFAVDFARGCGLETYGKAVTPIASGTISGASYDPGYGFTVLVDHGGGYVSRYAHFSEILVSVGEPVSNRSIIGKVGNTGTVYGACVSYPGAHLHMALYHHGVGIPPEPISGIPYLETGCEYNRYGDSDCEIGPIDPEEDDDELEIRSTNIAPARGSLDTYYVWSVLVDSPGGMPNVDLWIENDGLPYAFPMETANTESPYIFYYRKQMSEAEDYTYWFTANNASAEVSSASEHMSVSPVGGDPMRYYYYWDYPSEGRVDIDLFQWNVIFESDSGMPEMTLQIFNPSDGVIYSFPMRVSAVTGNWVGSFNKTLSEPITYTYWIVADNVYNTNTAEVGSIRVYE